MRGSSPLWFAAAVIKLCSASPTGGACNADNCLRAVRGTAFGSVSRSVHLEDCSSFFSLVAVPSNPTVTVTVTPTPTVFATTIDERVTVVSEIVWPTTVNTEITATDNTIVFNPNRKRTAENCPITTVVRPAHLPDFAAKACGASSRFSSACVCAGVTPRTQTQDCFTVETTVTAPPAPTVFDASALILQGQEFVTETRTTALIDPIPCEAEIEIEEEAPAYRVVCEAEGTGNRTLLETINGTDWNNCVHRATFGLEASDWEFDLDTNVCKIYDKLFSESGTMIHNVTAPRSRHVYAFILD